MAQNEMKSLDLTCGIHQEGLAWLVKIPENFRPGDCEENHTLSKLILYEDDRELGPAHSQHDSVRHCGAGAYSHWGDALYFSTSDGSDPRTNGRTYRIGFRTVKMLVIALDGVDPQTLHRYVDGGHLPQIAKLLQRSREVELRTMCDFFGPSCWAGFSSGLSVGSHGIHAYRPLRLGTLQPVDSTEFKMPVPFWERTARAGISTSVLDVPHYPVPVGAPELAQLRFVEWAPHPPQRQPSSMPSDLLPHMMDRFGCHPFPIDVKSLQTPEDAADHVACIAAGARKRAAVVNELIRMTHPELVVAVFSEIHTATHQWSHREAEGHRSFDADLRDAIGSPIRSVCEAVDGAIGRVLDNLPSDATVLLTCLGGERITHGGSYFLHDLLVRLGYCVYPTYNSEEDKESESWKEYESPPDLCLDWRLTRAFTLPWQPEGYLRLNLKNREPYGIVTEGTESAQILDKIEAAVRSLRLAGTDEPAAKAVLRPREQYAGLAAVAELPDMMVLWNNSKPIVAVESELVGRIENRDLAIRSAHCNRGVLFASGPNIAPGATISGYRDFDVPPTILKMLELPLPQNLDGRIIAELFESALESEITRQKSDRPENGSVDSEVLIEPAVLNG